ncbi:MAG: CCA tRNA nucleotidyltransferase [Caldiserica bacterium]|jgi:putative nucleotidyltransferase with HDIG domain|nr:CCA tRNA nucleotidyltransferase [Caldisericota bacterium]MDH7563027.1 CCA tRNA nucleotidyltransferase [Caldisericota bacterium]
MRTEEIIQAIKEIARNKKMKVWLVGGAVRDLILKKREIKDLDFVITEGSAQELARELASSLSLSPPVVFPRFGTAQLTFNGWKVEFVDARKESYLEDSRKPIVERSSLLEDLKRRDFTINTLVQDLESGKILDLLGLGLEDIKKKIIRTPLDPDTTFRDDPLRMLRAVRFACRLNFEIHSEAKKGIEKNAELLKLKVSPERIKAELDLIVSEENPAKGILLLDELKILPQIFPELEEAKGIPQDKVTAKDLFSHSVQVLQRISRDSNDLRERYAALFHDIGKIKAIQEKGEAIVFYGHEEEGALLAEEILKRLRFSNEEIEEICFLIRNHMLITQYTPEWSDSAVKRLIRRLGEKLKSTLRLARADIYGIESLESNFWHLIGRIQALDQEQVKSISSPLSGDEIMDLLGISPGPQVGEIKEEIVEAILEGKIENNKESAIKYLKKKYGNLTSKEKG